MVSAYLAILRCVLGKVTAVCCNAVFAASTSVSFLGCALFMVLYVNVMCGLARS
jgi:hypothetical protein